MSQMDAEEFPGGRPARDPQTYAIIGAAIEVHRQMGPGFLEGVYQEALGFELTDREVPYRRKLDLPVVYKGRMLACSWDCLISHFV